MSARRHSYLANSLAIFFAAAISASGCGSDPPVPRYAMSERGGDRDGDGAADIDDACPNDAEDGLPPKANDGCPAIDPDNDGILLADDRCPDAKEDAAPPNPNDGCPTTDSDGDGVADAVDRCLDKLEDNLAPAPNDGCPSPDRDGDGVADFRDRCPTQPETRNGYRDEDGCPDTAPGEEVVFDKEGSEIYVPETKKIDFEHDSAEITPAAQATLNDVAKVLKAHPEVQRVEIEGHASTKGDANYNLGLTERRAQAVARGLEKLGVEPARLVAIGYGEFCPATDVGDEVDEAKNRRVLLKAVVVNGVWQEIPRGCWRAQTAGINPTKRQPGAGGGAAGKPATQPPVVKPVGGA